MYKLLVVIRHDLWQSVGNKSLARSQLTLGTRREQKVETESIYSNSIVVISIVYTIGKAYRARVIKLLFLML